MSNSSMKPTEIRSLSQMIEDLEAQRRLIDAKTERIRQINLHLTGNCAPPANLEVANDRQDTPTLTRLTDAVASIFLGLSALNGELNYLEPFTETAPVPPVPPADFGKMSVAEYGKMIGAQEIFARPARRKPTRARKASVAKAPAKKAKAKPRRA